MPHRYAAGSAIFRLGSTVMRLSKIIVASSLTLRRLVPPLAVTLGCLLIFQNRVSASIACVALPSFSYVSESDSDGDNGNHQPLQSSDCPEDQPSRQVAAQFALGSSPSSVPSSSSSSSSTNSLGSSYNHAVRFHEVVNLAGLEMCGWISGDLRFSLPDPPHFNLLRPPRAS
jgi:hypothetical protein